MSSLDGWTFQPSIQTKKTPPAGHLIFNLPLGFEKWQCLPALTKIAVCCHLISNLSLGLEKWQ
jgi:hypothetical protein